MSDFFKEYFGCNGPCPEADRLRNFQPPQYITDLTNEFIGCLPDPAPFPCSAITDCALDTYVTGGTLTQPTNSTNDGFINLLYNANISASTYSLPYTDTFTTGGTYDNSTALITFIKNDSSQYTVDLSTIGVNDTFVTGFTYNNENTFILSRNDGVDLSATINIMSGLTINGDLTVTGDTFLQSTTASTLTLSSTPTENNTNTEILSRNSISGEVEYRDISTFGVNITVVTGTTYTATTTDNVIGVDTSVNPVTIYLPDSIISGKLGYRVKDIGPNSYVNPITIQAAGSDTILTTEVVSSFDLSTDGGAVVLINTASGVWWQM